MDNSHNYHWSEQKEVGSRFFLAILTWIAFKLGRRSARLLLIFITVYFYLRGAKARKASRRYLRRVLKKNPSWFDVYQHFYYFACVTLDRLFLLTGRLNLFDIEIHGKNLFNEMIAAQQGCLLFVSHIGSFEVMRVLGSRDHSLPIHILMDQNHNSIAMQLITRLDPELADRIIEARQTSTELVLKMNELIQEGGMVGIMVDRLRPREAGVECSLLGGTANLPAGPWQMAAALKVPVVMCFGLYDGKNRYNIHFELLSEKISSKRSERSVSITNHIQEYCQRLEHYLSVQPFNWFNFYEFWKDETTGH
ncbi:MAG: lipid A biosynthesis acyltransferase [Gammaproteobacteria bacterium]|nr:lipid A biosynthesis acyltransferase [Gammaproteobacteria bacterium]